MLLNFRQNFYLSVRFLCGMGLGFELAVATVYIVEIASTDMRGILGERASEILALCFGQSSV
jgi:hypothetical protein